MKHTLLYTFCWCILSFQLYASHNKGGEITFKRVSGLTYEVSLVTYTENSSQGLASDRSELALAWGDGKLELIPRISRTEVQSAALPMQVIAFKNVYRAQHTYASAGTFKIQASDFNRIPGVLNMTSSEISPFVLETELLANSLQLNTSSVEFNKSAVDIVCAGKPFSYEPGTVNTDGDSLDFSFVSPIGASGFALPAGLSIDGSNGKISWNSPAHVGVYSLGLLVTEYKNGNKVGSIQRELQFTVLNCPASTGIRDEPGLKTDLVLFPIPTSGQLGLKWQGRQKPESVQVLDVMGRDCGARPLRVSDETGPDKMAYIDLEGLRPGIYVLVCSSAGQAISRSFIIE